MRIKTTTSMLAVMLLGLTRSLAADAAPPSSADAETQQRLEGCWAELAGSDPIQALAALLTMADEPEAAVKLVAARVKPVRANPKQIDLWIADLDSPHFAARTRASAELEWIVDFAQPQLRKALENQPSLELKRRLERVLEALPSGGESSFPARVQAVRAIAFLEHVGSEDARRLLQTLTAGNDSWPTRAASAARQRLAQPAAPPSQKQLIADLHGTEPCAAARAFLTLSRRTSADQSADSAELLYLVGRAPLPDPFAPRQAAPRPVALPPYLRAVRILFCKSSEDEPPFRKAVRAAAAALRAGESDFQFEQQLAAPAAPAQREALRKRLETLQRERLAPAMAPLMRAEEDLREVEADSSKQPAYWQASAAYLRVRLLGRIALLYEYNVMLAQARKDDLPALDPESHRGWRIQPRVSYTERDAQKIATEARKLAQALAANHAGTPWADATSQMEVILCGLQWDRWDK
jgi:hypothetical protein